MNHQMDFAQARKNMVENQLRCCKVLDPVVIETFASLPREAFLASSIRSLAYMDGHAPIPCQQEMLNPTQEGRILQALELTGTERVLEIGTGVGFFTAVLALHSDEVVSLELHEELANKARRNLVEAGIENADIHCCNAFADGALDAFGDFDVIVVGTTLEQLPDSIKQHARKQIIAFIGSNPVVQLKHMRFQAQQQTWLEDSLFETMLQSAEGLTQSEAFVF